MKRVLLATACWALAAGAAMAADGISITIYNNDLALVEDTRTLDIAAGRSRLEFKDVSSSIRPETVALSASGVATIEQNFDYDLLSPEKMMEKAVGTQVQIVRTNPGTGKETVETATVLAVNNGVVLRVGDRIEVLRDDGVPTRVIFPKVPDNLRARPTLSVTVQSSRAGARETKLSYLSTGLSWKADYVALFDEKASALDLQGWITLTNQSGTGYKNAETRLVAGNIGAGLSYSPRRPTNIRSAGSETNEGDAVGDYYIYPLKERTTIAENQTKQVGFLDVNDAQAKKVYEYRADSFQSQRSPQSANVMLQFSNARAGGIGAALPAGTVRVYMRDTDGDPRFVGENTIGHTPQGSILRIKTGSAFDVTVQPTVVSSAKDGNRTRYQMEYLFRNARAEPVTVEFMQSGLSRGARVFDESLKGERTDAYTQSYSVVVPANGETKLTFSALTEW